MQPKVIFDTSVICAFDLAASFIDHECVFWCWHGNLNYERELPQYEQCHGEMEGTVGNDPDLRHRGAVCPTYMPVRLHSGCPPS